MKTLRDLHLFVGGDPGLSQLQRDIVGSHSSDPSHDLAHSHRVAFWTCRIGAPAVVYRLSIAAALCHDIVNLPKNSPDRNKASLESAKKASELLPRYGFDPNSVLEISDAIRDHSYSRGAVPQTPLGRSLQDADRLDALGAIGIMRCVSTAVQLGAKFFDADDPWAEYRPLDEKSFAIDHFFTKLLRLPKTMCTELGRNEANRRVEIMTAFLNALSIELATPRPRVNDD
jgi:uncharacterized protein